MSIETDLKKDGITVIAPLDHSSVVSIAQSVSRKLYLAFPNFGFSFEDLFENVSNIPMYIAKIPNGMSEASYFYKNSSIYFRDGMGLADLEKYSIHEFIHHFQECKDKNGNLIRLGLCEFSNTKLKGMALNEAAVQILASNALNSTFENVEYYGLTFSTISSNVYPLICNLVAQMGYITGEDILFDSTFNSNNGFKNKFIALCGKKSYFKIIKNLDKVLDTEEKIIILTNNLQNNDLNTNQILKINTKIENLKSTIKSLYCSTQETIITSYFNTLYNALSNNSEAEHFRKTLYNFQELIGTTPNYYFFNNFYIEMMEKIDHKYDNISNSTYLIPRSNSKLIQFINYLKKLISKKQFENENMLKNK